MGDYIGKDFHTDGILSGLPLSNVILWKFKKDVLSDTPFKLPGVAQQEYEASFLGCFLGHFIVTWDNGVPLSVVQM